MKIYTKTGDDGTTGLYRGGRLSKAHPLVRSIGTIDELNCCLGVVRSSVASTATQAILARIQHQMFEAGADLASMSVAAAEAPASSIENSDSAAGRVQATHIAWLETSIDACEQLLPPLRQFILPGGSIAAAHCHHARAVCRRAERELVELKSEIAEGPQLNRLRIYLNRLADLLFVLARRINQEDQVAETVWAPDGSSSEA